MGGTLEFMKWLRVFSFFTLMALRVDGAVDLSGVHEPLKTVVQNYLAIHQELAGDSFTGIPPAANAMKAAMTGPNAHFEPDFIQAVAPLAAAPDLHSARLAFQSVSNDLIAALAQNQVQTGELRVVFCPMVKAYWVQTDGKNVQNPYYGSAMLDCGAFQRQF
jgi:hypothetical protein